jgi:hypothetical protein
MMNILFRRICMANIIVTLKDGSTREYSAGVTLLEVAKSLSQKLGKVAYSQLLTARIRILQTAGK